MTAARRLAAILAADVVGYSSARLTIGGSAHANRCPRMVLVLAEGDDDE
jgi:hypothetical protein